MVGEYFQSMTMLVNLTPTFGVRLRIKERAPGGIVIVKENCKTNLIVLLALIETKGLRLMEIERKKGEERK